MILPKRIINHKRLREFVNGEEQSKITPTNLKRLIGSISTADRYFLDENNAIVLINNPDETSEYKYIMIHYRLVEGKLIEINRWYHCNYYFGSHDRDVIKKLNLFMVQGGHGIGANSRKCHHAIYHYKLDKFIIPEGQFDCIGTTNWVAGMNYYVSGPNYLEEYGCFLAYFTLSSTYEEGDIISYQNPVTMEEIDYNFNYRELYFALLNTDGTIRGNKLFYGKDFSRISNHIDLDDYSSLEDFKQKRTQILNQNKRQDKEKYYQRLETSGQKSPYLDQEVFHILKLEQKKKKNSKSSDIT